MHPCYNKYLLALFWCNRQTSFQYFLQIYNTCLHAHINRLLPQKNLMWNSMQFNMAQEYFKSAEGGVLVDVSCGSGLFSRKFAKSGAYSRVVALDFSENMLRQCYDFIKDDVTILGSWVFCFLLFIIALEAAQIIRIRFIASRSLRISSEILHL